MYNPTAKLPHNNKFIFIYLYLIGRSRSLSIGQTLINRCADEQCFLNTDNENYDLVIKSVVLGDGGKYCCKEQFNTEQHGFVEVIVFGKVHFNTLKLMSHRNYICTVVAVHSLDFSQAYC